MMVWGGGINDSYGWEVAVLHKLRELSDGLSVVEVKVNYDRYLADHSPRFIIHVVLFNWTVVEFSIYHLGHQIK